MAVLFLWSLGACSGDPVRLEDESSDVDGFSVDTPSEELYFEILRKCSAGLFSPQDIEAVHLRLDVIDERYSTDEDHDRLSRLALFASLRRAREAARRRMDPAIADAYEGQAYARRLHHAGVREANAHAEGTLLIAGMLGFPTSKDELVLIAAAPAGGYVVARIVGLGFKRAALLLRRIRTPEDVLRRAGALGIEVRQVKDLA
ncbi:MAG: hypothetical protein ABW123_00115, partial [Cystobacter sp.]